MNLSHELNTLTFLKAALQKSCNRQNKMSCGNENLFRREPAYCGCHSKPIRTRNDAYRPVAWSAVYTSPVKRTIATAKPLCEALGLEMQQRSGHRNQNENPGDDAVKVTRDSSLTEMFGCLGRTTRFSLSYAITKKGCARSPSDPRSGLPSGKATSTSAKRCGKADGSSSQSSRNVAKRKPVLDLLGGHPLPRSYVVVAASAKRPRSVRSSSCHGGTRHQA